MLIRLRITKPRYGRKAICPGPKNAWFKREYYLDEMIGHIYGRGKSLGSKDRPHMFAKELVMYLNYVSELVDQIIPKDKPQW